MRAQPFGHNRLDFLEKAQELVGAMATIAIPNHRASGDVERGQERRLAAADAVLCSLFDRVRRHRRNGWVRSSAWYCDISSTNRTGGYQAHKLNSEVITCDLRGHSDWQASDLVGDGRVFQDDLQRRRAVGVGAGPSALR